MTNFQVEERAKLKKHQVDQAISLAMQSKWDEAVSANRSILDLYPKDVDAYNRLGRALTELGRYGEARDAYRQAVSIDPLNAIAQKNLTRLQALNVEADPTAQREKVDPRFFIAETGKTGVTNLVRVAQRQVLAKLAVGDQVYLHPDGRALFVRNSRGDNLGQVEPKLSQRLIDLLRGGNRYAAAVMSLTETSIRILIRETYQDPSQSGKVSFPTRGEAPQIRPYTKGNLVRYDDDDDEGSDDSDFDSDADEADEPADSGDFEEDRSQE